MVKCQLEGKLYITIWPQNNYYIWCEAFQNVSFILAIAICTWCLKFRGILGYTMLNRLMAFIESLLFKICCQETKVSYTLHLLLYASD